MYNNQAGHSATCLLLGREERLHTLRFPLLHPVPTPSAAPSTTARRHRRATSTRLSNVAILGLQVGREVPILMLRPLSCNPARLRLRLEVFWWGECLAAAGTCPPTRLSGCHAGSSRASGLAALLGGLRPILSLVFLPALREEGLERRGQLRPSVQGRQACAFGRFPSTTGVGVRGLAGLITRALVRKETLDAALSLLELLKPSERKRDLASAITTSLADRSLNPRC